MQSLFPYVGNVLFDIVRKLIPDFIGRRDNYPRPFFNDSKTSAPNAIEKALEIRVSVAVLSHLSRILMLPVNNWLS